MVKFLTVIPAAGNGSRLGLSVPKILAPIEQGVTIWSILLSKIASLSGSICVVMSPWGELTFKAASKGVQNLDLVIQSEPLGMGHAIFCASKYFKSADVLMVVWGDQVNVSCQTLVSARTLHDNSSKTIVIPTVRLKEPYVEYRFDIKGQLLDILQAREGDICSMHGYGDVGTFVLSLEGLEDAWNDYLRVAKRGSSTGELNFLPFLVYLARNGWAVKQLVVDDDGEARGVNTKKDLEFARLRLKSV